MCIKRLSIDYETCPLPKETKHITVNNVNGVSLESTRTLRQLHCTAEGLYCVPDQINFLRNNTVPAVQTNDAASSEKKEQGILFL
jgi:hypothetical protein